MCRPIIPWWFTDLPCIHILPSTIRRRVITPLVLRLRLEWGLRWDPITAEAGAITAGGATATSTSISITITLNTTTTRTLTGTETGPAPYLLAAATTGNTIPNIVVELRTRTEQPRLNT